MSLPIQGEYDAENIRIQQEIEEEAMREMEELKVPTAEDTMRLMGAINKGIYGINPYENN